LQLVVAFDESDENPQTSRMTTTLNLPDDLVEEIHLRAEQEGRELDETVAELLRAGLAASSSRTPTAVRATASMLEERKRIAEKFRSGEWGVDLPGFEEGRWPIATLPRCESDPGDVDRTSR
jgi:plasmid stability protein